MYVTTINAKGSHEFEREQGRLNGRVWRNEKEGENDAVIISKITSFKNYIYCNKNLHWKMMMTWGK